MKLKIVFHYSGIVVTVVGLLMIVPIACSLMYRENDWPVFLFSAVITWIFGLFSWGLTPPAENRLSIRETLAIVTFTWILISAFGALPFVLSGTLPDYIDALFESVSGFTTTGASVFTDVEVLSHGILFWRSFTQWLGGMGIITLFVALLPMMSIGADRLIQAETATAWEHKITARIRDTARILWLVYCGLSVLEIIFLIIAGLPAFDAVTITFSTISTGGFGIANLSIGTYDNVPVEIIVTVFMILGATNFGLLSTVFWKKKPGQLLKNQEFLSYMFILAGAITMIVINLVINGNFNLTDAIRYAVFNAASVSTTTGFANYDFNLWPDFSRVMLLILMIIGASAGSTGGGIKVIRFLLLVKYIYQNILHTINPRLVKPMKIDGEVIPESVYSPLIGMTLLYFIFLAAGCLALTSLGVDITTAFSATATTLGTTGPGLGLVGPMANFSGLPLTAKGILTLYMLLGRLELFTFLALLVPFYWKWR